MSLYDLYIYDKHGQCLIHRPLTGVSSSDTAIHRRQKLLFGMVYTMSAFVKRVDPLCDQTPRDVMYINTPKYKTHMFETRSGLRFILVSTPDVAGAGDLLREIYILFVDYVTSTPMYQQGFIPEVTSQFDLHLKERLLKYVQDIAPSV